MVTATVIILCTVLVSELNNLQSRFRNTGPILEKLFSLLLIVS